MSLVLVTIPYLKEIMCEIKIFLKKNYEGGLAFPNTTPFYEAVIIETVWHQ